jgi:hypothetical protein
MEILSKIIDLLNDKFSFPIAILCSFLLFAPDWMLQRLDLLNFVGSTGVVISITFLFSSILYLYGRGKRFTQYLKSKIETRAKRKVRKRTIASHIKGLTLEEQYWIYFCLRDHVRTLYAPEINDTAVALESKLLIYRPKSVYDRQSTPFTFYPEVWKYLAKKKDKYCPHERLKDREFNEKVNRFIKGLRSTT